jgi:hypothetical protein
MPVDWSEPAFVFLRSQLKLGRVVLFTGAGFDCDARNQSQESPPLGAKLAELLAVRSGFPYTGEKLSLVYEAARRRLGDNYLWEYLSELYEVVGYADWYSIVRQIAWHRIYTTNIDSLLQRVYAVGTGQTLRTIVNPAPHIERDALFRDLQAIHLHGHIQYRENGLIFTLSEFGGLTATPDPWYQALTDDLFNRPVVFIGTTLEEPMLYHYIQLRDQRPRSMPEFRPNSFLVCRTIGPINTAALKDRNITAVESTGREFFESLKSQIGLDEFSLAAVRRTAIPHVTFHGDNATFDERVNRHFDFIMPLHLPFQRKSRPDEFFMGAEPDWYDIAQRRDALRIITSTLVDAVSAPRDRFSCFVLHGPAGSGKTTTLMRAAEQLSAKGFQVFYAKGLERLDLSGLIRLSEEPANRDKRFLFVIDVLHRHTAAIQAIANQLLAAPNVSLLVAERSNKYASLHFPIADCEPDEIRMPDLCEEDVIAILAKLDSFGFLGELRGKTPNDQIGAFMQRAEKQLLVALREATSGQGFDFILRTEYSELAAPAKLAYAICCIAVAHGAPGVYTRHLLPCLGKTEFKKAIVIRDLLRGVLVPANPGETMLKPRHRLIAHWVANQIAAQGEKVEAVTSFLKQIAPDITPNEIRRRSPAYLAYRGMINSEALKETFSNDWEIILGIYEELKPFYDNDFLFWLQFGMAHIGAQRYDVAENYLDQSLAIWPNSHQTLHQMGCLYLIQAARSPNPTAVQERANRGIELLSEQIKTKGDDNSYPYHAYLTHVSRWYESAASLIAETDWASLRRIAVEAVKKYPRDDMIRDVDRLVERRYLLRAVVDAPSE